MAQLRETRVRKTIEETAHLLRQAGVTDADIMKLRNSELTYKEIGVKLTELLADRTVTRKDVPLIFEVYGVPPRTVEENNRNRLKSVRIKAAAKPTVAERKLTKQQTEEIAERYQSGETVFSLAKLYSVTDYTIRSALSGSGVQLRDDSAQAKHRRGLSILQQNSADCYRKLYESHPDWSISDLVRHIQNSLCPDSGLSYKTVYFYVKNVLGITPDPQRQARARSVKSRSDRNPSYTVKTESVKAVEKIYGSVDTLAELYCSNTIGPYSKISATLNAQQSDFMFTPRRVAKLITSSSQYTPARSRAEKIFIRETVEALGLKDTDFRESVRPYEHSTEEIDLVVDSLGVAFEFNGDYWHSDAVIEYNYGVTAEERHRLKRERAKNTLGLRLLYVWENDFNTRYEKVMRAVREHDWDNPILNKLSNTTERSYSSPQQLKKMLKQAGVQFTSSRNGVVNIGSVALRPASVGENTRNYRITAEYRAKGRDLLTVYPWFSFEKTLEFIQHQNSVSSQTVYARKCSVETADTLTKKDREFIEQYHLLGNVKLKGERRVWRLMYEGETLGLAVFTENSQPHTVELKRLIFKAGYSIPGGASKLCSAAVKHYRSVGVTDIVTFSDCDISRGAVYGKLGFIPIQKPKPGVVYFNPQTKQKFTRVSLYAVGADRLLRNHPGYTPVGIGEGLPSNEEIVLSHGFLKYCDSGSVKWRLTL